ncbi:MAG: hypothetical protein LBR56_03540 [Sporomusaceae bacterium]|jgi:hypothetical protein|nr:hypothetical protein [Sporomusaceae bacterium]
MSKTIFDVEDIHEIRHLLSQEYASMPKDAVKALKNERVQKEMYRIAQLRFITLNIDVCQNDLQAVEALRKSVFGRKQ